MARDHARIRLDIWSDDDFRRLPALGQWLYLYLITSPALNFCGVTDWRPARIAAITAELTGADVELAASALEAGEFVVVDRDSEEILIRSFIKHDGLMKSPNMVKAMVSAHNRVASWPIRAVVIGQLVKLKEADTKAEMRWEELPAGFLKRESLTPSEAVAQLPPNPSPNPFGNPSSDSSSDSSGDPSATHLLPSSLAPSLPSSLPRSKKVLLSAHQEEAS